MATRESLTASQPPPSPTLFFLLLLRHHACHRHRHCHHHSQVVVPTAVLPRAIPGLDGANLQRDGAREAAAVLRPLPRCMLSSVLTQRKCKYIRDATRRRHVVSTHLGSRPKAHTSCRHFFFSFSFVQSSHSARSVDYNSSRTWWFILSIAFQISA